MTGNFTGSLCARNTNDVDDDNNSIAKVQLKPQLAANFAFFAFSELSAHALVRCTNSALTQICKLTESKALRELFAEREQFSKNRILSLNT